MVSMTAPRDEQLARSVAAASALVLAFAALLVALDLRVPPSDAERHAADPLVQLLGAHAPWIIVAATIAVAAAWRRYLRIERRDLIWAFAGVAVAVALAFALRGIIGPRLPSFIPREESAGPGVTLGVAAGLIEEVMFRLVLLPVTLFVLARRIDHRLATVLAVVITAALFSLSHELGPAGGVFAPRFMLTRFVVPGIAMSSVALRTRMSFLVFAHCTAHLVIPSLFA
jgi:membrane protease YdiL (CAAX protease family)